MKKTLLLIFISLFVSINAQTKNEIKKITKNYNKVILTKMAKEFSTIYKKNKTFAIKFAQENNLPLIVNGKNGYIAEIQRIVDGKPIYYETKNIIAARSTRANFLHNGASLGLNIEGQNMTAYVWDGQRARASHIEFNVGGNSKVTDGDTGIGAGTTNNNHGTHVTGTIVAIGANTTAKGIAPQANVIGYTWNNDLVEATIAVNNGMLLSNHSYGAIAQFLQPWQFGAYDISSRRWDNLMYSAPYYLMVSAAGNDGNDNSSNTSPLDNISNRDKLSFDQTSKNGLTVANGQDLSVNSNGELNSSPAINSSSSQGPTDDYRIKPDITGNGTFLFSPIGTSDNAYDSYMGTSMASPNITGSLLLLQQLYNQEKGQFALAATIKGLALHTADNGGSAGPDAVFGWGYMNTKKAAEVILSSNSILQERTLNDGETLTFDIIANGTDPLGVSISWTDPPSNNVNFGTINDNTPVLVNDLDIRLTKNGVTSRPWKLTSANNNTNGDNLVDPFEKIDIIHGNGTYTVTVNHKGSITNNSQNFTIIVTGITSSNLSTNSNQLENVNVWPNPTNGLVNLTLNTFIDTDISVYNTIGEKVFKKHLNNNNTNNQINLSNLTKGIYYISITQNNKFYTEKLILN